MGRKFIVEFHRSKQETHEENLEEKSPKHHVKTHAKMKDVFGEVDSFVKYTEKYGMHFSEKLSKHVCHNMVNVSEIDKATLSHPEHPKHSWTAEEVEAAIKNLGLTFIPEHKYDYHYAANMAFADFYGQSLKEEMLCIRHAHAMVHDPDGYPELVFSRWLCDIVGKEEDIDWEEFI